MSDDTEAAPAPKARPPTAREVHAAHVGILASLWSMLYGRNRDLDDPMIAIIYPRGAE